MAFMPENVTGKVLPQLEKWGFFDAPASSRFHGAYAGGLFDHSYEVAIALVDLTEKMGLNWQRPESPYIVGMLHDLCKHDSYLLQEDGAYARNEHAAPGHGEKSVSLIKQLIPLTEEETLCIRWHMGAFDEKENWNCYNNAVKQFPNVLFTHTADMIASQVKGV